jgi:hypothetical protein
MPALNVSQQFERSCVSKTQYYQTLSLKGEKPVQLVNETQPVVTYQISTSSGSLHDQGTIEVDGLVDLPAYDNQTNVSVQFYPEAGGTFQIEIGDTTSGEQVEMAVVAG